MLATMVVMAGVFAWAAVVSLHPARAGVLAAAAVCAAATATLIVSLAVRVRAAARLSGHGEFADAQVTSVRRSLCSGSDFYGIPGYSAKVTVSFTAASGRHVTGQYQARLTERSGERPGRIIRVVYDPRRPARFRLASDSERAAAILITGLAVVAVCLAATAWLFLRALS